MHSDSWEAHFAHCPGLKLVAPATPADAKGLLLSAIRAPDPVMVMEPLGGYRLFRGEVPEGDYTVPIGKARVARDGTDCTVVAWSAAVEVANQAAEDAADQGVSVEVVDLRTLVPLDMDALRESVTKTGRVVVIHEASLTGGFASEVITSLQEDDDIFYSLQGPMQRICGPDTPYPVQEIQEGYFLHKQRVLKAILKTLEG